MSTFDDHEHYNNTDAAIRAGMALAEPHHMHGTLHAFVLPEGAALKELDVEAHGLRPTRKRGTYVFGDAKSFARFVNRERTEETVIFANRESPSFTAVFNGHEPHNTGDATGDTGGPVLIENASHEPGWGDYRATYSCPYSPEWRVWSAANGKRMSQHDFSTFMEDNFLDVVQPAPTFDPRQPSWPDGDTMLAVSRGLEAKTDVRFASAVRLDNGQVRFKYEEDVSGLVQAGLLEVPQRFAVGIPVFAGTAPWQLVAKLRYRIERGGLTMWYDFERLFKVTERAFDEARNEISEATNVPIFLGSRA